MIAWYIAKAEWIRLWRNRLGRLAILAALFVPLLYCGLYLYAFWDPYGTLERLPVALVNDDRGGGYHGKYEYLGQEVVKEIQEKINLDWHVVSRQEAQQGVEGNKYFLAIIIPEDFTERSLSITTDHPEKAKIYYIRNEGKNYVAGQIANRIESEMSTGIGKKFTKEYIKNILDLINTSKTGLTRAAEATDKLAQGAEQLYLNSSKIQDAIRKAFRGANQLSIGMSQFTSATNKLKEGATKISEGNAKLANLAEKVKVPLQQAKQLIQQFKQSGVLERVQRLANQAERLSTLYEQIRDDWKMLTSSRPDLAINPIAQRLDDRIMGTIDEIRTLRSQIDELRSSLGSITEGGSASFPLERLNQVELLAKGSKQVAEGIAKLNTGANQLKKGINQLSFGLNQLNQQLSKFVAGAKKLSEGNRALADKLKDALSSQKADSDVLANVISDPVDTEDHSLHRVSLYGVGLAPYFLPLSLWIGTIILYFTLPINETRWKFGPYRLGLVPIGQYLSLYPFGVVQALITGAVVHYGLGLPIQLYSTYYVFLICIALMSITVIGFLIGTFGNGPGRLLAIIVLVLQLVASGGTFPTELIPSSLQKISGFLPMSYGVNGLRNIIALNRPQEMPFYFTVLLCFLSGALIVSILIQRRSLSWHDLKDHDELEAG